MAAMTRTYNTFCICVGPVTPAIVGLGFEIKMSQHATMELDIRQHSELNQWKETYLRDLDPSILKYLRSSEILYCVLTLTTMNNWLRAT